MRKFASCLLSLAAVGYASADEKTPAVTEVNVHGTTQPKNAPNVEQGNWYAGVDFLYWQAQEDNLEYGLVDKATIGLVTPESSGVQKNLKMHFHWDPGFRVKFGYSGNGRDWDLLATYTYMHNTARGSKSIAGLGTLTAEEFVGYTIVPAWFQLFSGSQAISASAKWNLNLNLGDLTVGRNFFISKHLAFNPFAGLRAGSINQHYQSNYGEPEFPVFFFSGAPPEAPIGGETQFKAKSQYSFGGIRGGTDILWHFNENFALLGKVSASVLYGKFEVKEFANGWAVGAEPAGLFLLPSSILVSNSYWRTRPNLEGYLGFQWETFFSTNHVALSVGYEISYWFQQNEWIDNTSQSTAAGEFEFAGILTSTRSIKKAGDLGLQGLTVELSFDF